MRRRRSQDEGEIRRARQYARLSLLVAKGAGLWTLSRAASGPLWALTGLRGDIWHARPSGIPYGASAGRRK